MNERKFGWTEKGILGMIFSPLGAFFVLLGLVLYSVGAGHSSEDPMMFLYVFGGMGSIFLLVGLGLLGADVHRRGVMRRAVNSGDYVLARIAGVQHRVNVNTNGTHPCVVECHYHNPDTGEMHVFFSRYLYFDPSDMFTSQEVPVYLDRMNEKTAFVDIDAVLPKVVLHR
ncbi:MAG: hypothetical protein IJQ62_12240 [Clostridia bacterium]|nr:hypothetical protein [Clostridia bacterium]MBR0229107.1 hypothetical protein [Clostridia bacterium]